MMSFPWLFVFCLLFFGLGFACFLDGGVLLLLLLLVVVVVVVVVVCVCVCFERAAGHVTKPAISRVTGASLPLSFKQQTYVYPFAEVAQIKPDLFTTTVSAPNLRF